MLVADSFQPGWRSVRQHHPLDLPFPYHPVDHPVGALDYLLQALVALRVQHEHDTALPGARRVCGVDLYVRVTLRAHHEGELEIAEECLDRAEFYEERGVCHWSPSLSTYFEIARRRSAAMSAFKSLRT